MITRFLHICTFLAFFFVVAAQEIGVYSKTLLNESYLVDYQLEVGDEKNEVLSLVNRLFKTQSMQIVLANVSESKAGKHYSLQVYEQGIPIKDCIVKVHVSNSGMVYQISSNLPNMFQVNFLQTEPPKPNLDEEKESLKIRNVHPVFYQDESGLFRVGTEVTLLNTFQNIFVERIYIDKQQYFERDLRTYVDTLVHGKAFVPDPLTTANTTYGAPIEDGIEFDTTTIVLQALANNNQAFYNYAGDFFDYLGATVFVNSETFTNNLATDSMFVLVKELFFDGDQVEGYTLDLVGDRNAFSTTIYIADANTPLLEAQTQWVTATGNYQGGVFRLENEFFRMEDVSSPTGAPATSTNDTFTFNRTQQGFEDYNTFYHLNAFKSYLDTIGYGTLHKQLVSVDAHGNDGADNSFYAHAESYDTISTNPLVLDTINISNILVFGEGGVDDAEDADVVVHEYGHALSFFASPFSNVGGLRQGLDEGFCDYLAASYSRSINEFTWENVFTWDGHNEFWTGRDAASDKTAEDIDEVQSIYYNAEIWSSTLMDLWPVLGREVTDQLAIQTMYYNMPNGTIQDAANNLFVSDSVLFDGANKCAINEVLVNRKFSNKACVNGEFVTGEGLIILNSANFLQGTGAIRLILQEEGFSSMDVQVFSISGQLLIEAKNLNTPYYSLSSETFPTGVFVVRVNTSKDRYESKLLKVK